MQCGATWGSTMNPPIAKWSQNYLPFFSAWISFNESIINLQPPTIIHCRRRQKTQPSKRRRPQRVFGDRSTGTTPSSTSTLPLTRTVSLSRPPVGEFCYHSTVGRGSCLHVPILFPPVVDRWMEDMKQQGTRIPRGLIQQLNLENL